MADRAQLVTELRVDDQLTGKLGAAKAQLAGLDAQAKKTGTSLGGLGASLGGVAKAGVVAFAAFKAVDVATDFLGGSVAKASALNETMAKSNVVFGQNAAIVEAWGKTAAQSLGQSTQQAIEARATIGNLFVTMGLGQRDVLDMSGNIVQLATDLASFNNIGTDEALTKLRAGLVGEAEPLRTLGIQLTEATVRAKALELGLVKGNGVLSESGKLQARYALILEQSKTAQGDFARTSDGLANSTKKLDAALADIQAKIGAGLTPILAAAATTLADDVIPFLGDAADGIGAVGKAAADAIGSVTDFFDALGGGGRRDDFDLASVIPVMGSMIVTGGKLRDRLHEQKDAQDAFNAAANGGSVTLAGFLAKEHGAIAATAGLTSETQLGAKAMLEKRDAELLAAAATQKAATFTTAMADESAVLNNNLLDAASGANALANALAAIPTSIDVKVNVVGVPFKPTAPLDPFEIGPNTPLAGWAPNGGVTGADVFLDRQRQESELAARQAAERERLADEAERKRKQAADEALAAAKKRAAEEARAYEKALSTAFDNAKKRAHSLFDALHDRTVKAIKDAETLAEKQHEGALQAIADQLKAAQLANAAPRTAAEKALNERQQAQARRGLVESLSAAQLAVQTNTDPKAAEDLARALRDATEALENFDDAAKIARLTEVEQTKNRLAGLVADAKTLAADKELSDAKAQAKKDLDAETIANAKRLKDFDAALAKLEATALSKKLSPAEQKAEIDKLGARFGITVDPVTGFHHITDPLITAIKSIREQPPQLFVNLAPNIRFSVSARELATAIISQTQPAATVSVRTGAGGRT